MERIFLILRDGSIKTIFVTAAIAREVNKDAVSSIYIAAPSFRTQSHETSSRSKSKSEKIGTRSSENKAAVA